MLFHTELLSSLHPNKRDPVMKNLVDNVSTTGPCKKIKQNTRVEFINLTFQLQSSDKEKLNTTFFREMNM